MKCGHPLLFVISGRIRATEGPQTNHEKKLLSLSSLDRLVPGGGGVGAGRGVGGGSGVFSHLATRGIGDVGVRGKGLHHRRQPEDGRLRAPAAATNGRYWSGDNLGSMVRKQEDDGRYSPGERRRRTQEQGNTSGYGFGSGGETVDRVGGSFPWLHRVLAPISGKPTQNQTQT